MMIRAQFPHARGLVALQWSSSIGLLLLLDAALFELELGVQTSASSLGALLDDALALELGL